MSCNMNVFQTKKIMKKKGFVLFACNSGSSIRPVLYMCQEQHNTLNIFVPGKKSHLVRGLFVLM